MAKKRPNLLGTTMAAGAALALLAGCLDRDVTPLGPNVTNVFLDTLNQNGVNKIDLLFTIDNSLSMADKQKFLQQAVPQLLNRLITPNCVNADGTPTGQTVGTNGACAQGTPEFTAIDDIHIGIVSSSLGGRGKPCTPGTTNAPFDDDKGHLVGSIRNSGTAADGTDITYPTYANLGFLAWDAKGKGSNPAGVGLSDKTALIDYFNKMVAADGEQGCGYESTLEAWYRFLVDPEPPSDIVLVNTDQGPQSQAVVDPVDGTVLQQRANFLRPDSLVAIIMMSDENDCSIIDYGQGWLVAGNDQPIPRPTSDCATNPNSPCCRNCQQIGAPAGCAPTSSDPNCQGADINLTTQQNAPNLRCWQTKRRFGFDLLFNIKDRYINGLTKPTVNNRANPAQAVPNPLMSTLTDPTTGNQMYPELLPRNDSSLIYLAGIVGVPWQDIATDATRDVANELTLMTYNDLVKADRWKVILGDPEASPPVLPTDPFMQESIEARQGTNPITNQATVNGGQNPLATINGHEYSVNPNLMDDLQYACIFQLPPEMVRDCTEAAFTSTDVRTRRGCDCKAGGTTDPVADRNRPLCQQPGGSAAGTTQYFAKAYPGTRELQALKAFGENSSTQNAIVASICPKVTDPAQSAASAYGYNSAVNAIINRLKEKLTGACLARRIVTDENNQISCQVIEVTRPGVLDNGCATAGREDIDPGLLPAVWTRLQGSGTCGGTRPACNLDNWTVCKLTQVDQANYDQCLNDPQPPNATGYCYIDQMPFVAPDGTPQCSPAQGHPEGCIGNAELVKSCNESQRRILRFVSSDPNNPIPAKNSTIVLGCKGVAFTE